MKTIVGIKKVEKNTNQYKDNNQKDIIKVISVEEYKNNILDRETIEHLLKSEEDIEDGRIRKATDVFKELEEKYGF